MIQFLKGYSIINKINNHIDVETKIIIDRLIAREAKVYLVGGAIRDYLLNYPINDFDLEVYNIDFDSLVNLFIDYDIYVNKEFKSIKLKNIEIALPRVELKVGLSYLDYQLSFIDIGPKQASARRDFTINSMMYCFNTNELLDFNNGQKDLTNKILRANNYDSFNDDATRVLRLLKYQSRYDFIIDSKTHLLAQEMNINIFDQPEQIVAQYFTEIIFAKHFDIEVFLNVLNDFFLVDDLKSCISQSVYHPEKSLYNHVVGVITSLKQYNITTKRDYLILFWSLLFHDYGKIINNKNHAQAGVDTFEKYEKYLVLRAKDRIMIKKLIKNHMLIREYAQLNDDFLMKQLSAEFSNQFYLLKIVGTCDYAGRVVDNDIEQIKMRISWYQNNILIKYKEVSNG